MVFAPDPKTATGTKGIKSTGNLFNFVFSLLVLLLDTFSHFDPIKYRT